MDCRRNQLIFEKLMWELEKKTLLECPELILKIGKLFLGRPYRERSLEEERIEHFIVNLREFDCVTFVETVVALVFLVKSRKKSFESFKKLLKKIRYRQGECLGYPSRLHYFSDWIYDNQKKGFLKDITAKIGGRTKRKPVNFMTTHLNLYPSLKDKKILNRMKSIEKAINRRPRFFIPKKSLRRLEPFIHNGDIIAVTTNAKGLDVQHVGFAVRVKNRIHLLHASRLEGKVVFSKRTLYRYLMDSQARTGVIVARIMTI